MIKRILLFTTLAAQTWGEGGQLDTASPNELLAARKVEAGAEANALGTLAVLEAHVRDLEKGFEVADQGNATNGAEVFVLAADSHFATDRANAERQMEVHLAAVKRIMQVEYLTMNATQGHQEVQQGNSLMSHLNADVARVQSINEKEKMFMLHLAAQKKEEMHASLTRLENTARKASKQWRIAGHQSVLAAESLAGLDTDSTSHPRKMSLEFVKEYEGIKKRSRALEVRAIKVGQQLRHVIVLHFSVVSDGITHHFGRLEDNYSATKLVVWQAGERLHQRKRDMATRIAGFSRPGETPQEAVASYEGSIVPRGMGPDSEFLLNRRASEPTSLTMRIQKSQNGVEPRAHIMAFAAGRIGRLAIALSLTGFTTISALAMVAHFRRQRLAPDPLQQTLLL